MAYWKLSNIIEDNEFIKEKCYVGIPTIIDEDFNYFDWRAPISSMFYDC